MLGQFKSFTSFSAPDLAVIKDFYAGKLGLNVVLEFPGVIQFQTGGDTKFMVYVKPDHMPASYTVLNFQIGDVEQAVDELISQEVTMEQYPELGTNEKGISTMGGNTMAWFKDPAGNIIGLTK